MEPSIPVVGVRGSEASLPCRGDRSRARVVRGGGDGGRRRAEGTAREPARGRETESGRRRRRAVGPRRDRWDAQRKEWGKSLVAMIFLGLIAVRRTRIFVFSLLFLSYFFQRRIIYLLYYLNE